MKNKLVNIGILLLLLFQLTAIEVFGKAVVSGYVRDAASGEELIGANVAIVEIGSGTITNSYGYYSVSLPTGFYTLVCSYVGYNTKRIPISWGKILS